MVGGHDVYLFSYNSPAQSMYSCFKEKQYFEKNFEKLMFSPFYPIIRMQPLKGIPWKLYQTKYQKSKQVSLSSALISNLENLRCVKTVPLIGAILK